MIKYRIWDNKFNKYRYDTDDGHTDIDDAGQTIGWYETCGEDAHIFLNLLKELQEDDRWVLQQWTGLQDKNGLDIYEGDVILDERQWEVRTVVHGEDLPAFFLSNIDGALKFFDRETAKNDYKVIGTIFGLNEMPCKPDHNGECLICNCWLSECHLHEHLNHKSTIKNQPELKNEQFNDTVKYKNMEDYLFRRAVEFIKKHPDMDFE